MPQFGTLCVFLCSINFKSYAMAIRINAKELEKVLEHTPCTQNIMLTGKHGIGKSQILERYFTAQGCKVVILFLGQMSDPGDLIGLPHFNEETGKTDFMPPYWFPTDGKPVVLFLDELNRARPEVLQTIMDLTLNRTLSGKKLPEGSRVISAVNDGEEYQLTDLDPALVSRFNIYEFSPTVEEWLLWATKNDVDPRVVDFIRNSPKYLDGDGTETLDRGLGKAPDRRAWTRVSDVIKNADQIDGIHKKIISGMVGTIATQAFTAFLTSRRILSGKDILLDFEKHKKTLAKYRLHEMAMVNEDIFRFLETNQFAPKDKNTMAENLKKYVESLQQAGKNEEIAHFASFLESDTYSKALSFIVTETPSVYEVIIAFIQNL